LQKLIEARLVSEVSSLCNNSGRTLHEPPTKFHLEQRDAVHTTCPVALCMRRCLYRPRQGCPVTLCGPHPHL